MRKTDCERKMTIIQCLLLQQSRKNGVRNPRVLQIAIFDAAAQLLMSTLWLNEKWEQTENQFACNAKIVARMAYNLYRHWMLYWPWDSVRWRLIWVPWVVQCFPFSFTFFFLFSEIARSKANKNEVQAHENGKETNKNVCKFYGTNVMLLWKRPIKRCEYLQIKYTTTSMINIYKTH